ncbi:hypothetical protein ACFSKU_21685 [Pontibacter silvestris]|uniref:Uncharacterized protein n=1 Tax=Pontibacter silvestris TaxID=2305183 RepID=A0ABW4X5Y7_9BACT|nr:hypothetical protein [Pontibacter silvestris]MCC9138340.1 hypothetical protein [Pontibacter silvestris]
MIKFMRSLFGFGGISENRSVAGSPASVDIQDVQYIKDSNVRLAVLHDLYNRYKNTPHQYKLKYVYEKTKEIHTYLVSKKKVHELEMFHLQNTDNFVNTFTVILDVHQRHATSIFSPLKTETKEKSASGGNNILKDIASEALKRNRGKSAVPEQAKQVNGSNLTAEASVAGMVVPDISIDTFSKVFYVKKYTTDGLISGEISFTSTDQEKESFLLSISAHLGIDRNIISYVGNTLMTLHNNNGSDQTEFVPVIHWKGFTYALHTKDYRLFPVRIQRRRL